MDRIGYVLKRFPRISETFVAAELIELERQGEQPVVFALARPPEPFQHAFVSGLAAPVVYLPYRARAEPRRVAVAAARAIRRHPGGFARAAGYCLWPPRPVAFRRLLQAAVLCDEAERRGVRHLHVHFATAAARVANLAWRIGGTPYSVTAHAKDIYHAEVRREHLREKLGSARFVATVSGANRRHLGRVLDGTARVEVIPNSADLRRLGPLRARSPARGRVMTIARLVEKKGLADLIAAMPLVRAAPARLEIAGEGPLSGSLRRIAAASGAPVDFLGALPQERVLIRLRRAEVFCLPCVVAADGDRDGLPTSVLEAMALGVPVVTTDVGGLGELVLDGRTGLVVPPGDPAAIAAAIDRLLRDRALAARLAAAGRRHVERGFALEDSVARLRSLFAGGA